MIDDRYLLWPTVVLDCKLSLYTSSAFYIFFSYDFCQLAELLNPQQTDQRTKAELLNPQQTDQRINQLKEF